MSLINCPECNKQISDKAEICIGCGAPVVLSYIIGKTISIPSKEVSTSGTLESVKLEIAERDFVELMNWNDAKKKCDKIGLGWRLPTKAELKLMYSYQIPNDGNLHLGDDRRMQIHGLIWLGIYWSSDEKKLNWYDLFDVNISYHKYAYCVHIYFSKSDENFRTELKNERYRVRAVRTSY
jgi:hypothetical protein